MTVMTQTAPGAGFTMQPNLGSSHVELQLDGLGIQTQQTTAILDNIYEELENSLHETLQDEFLRRPSSNPSPYLAASTAAVPQSPPQRPESLDSSFEASDRFFMMRQRKHRARQESLFISFKHQLELNPIQSPGLAQNSPGLAKNSPGLPHKSPALTQRSPLALPSPGNFEGRSLLLLTPTSPGFQVTPTIVSPSFAPWPKSSDAEFISPTSLHASTSSPISPWHESDDLALRGEISYLGPKPKLSLKAITMEEVLGRASAGRDRPSLTSLIEQPSAPEFLPIPSAWNNYLGFCPGAVQAQDGDANAIVHAKANTLKCSNSKCGFQLQGTEMDLDEASGVSYRRAILFKSHCHQKKSKNDHYIFQCILCTFSRRKSPIIQGTAMFIEHMASHRHHAHALPPLVLQKAKCVVSEQPSQSLDFDIKLPPMFYKPQW